MTASRTRYSGRWLAATVLTLVAVTGCSEQDAVDRARSEASSAVDQADLPDVDWQRYSGQLQDRLDKLAEEADCSGLQQELARAEGNDTEIVDYIKAQLRELGC